MAIRAVPVEIYRQTGESLSRKDSAGRREQVGIDRNYPVEALTIPQESSTEDISLRVAQGPSLLRETLSTEEKSLLEKYFARFGDTPQDSPVYSTDARTRPLPLTGLKVDVKV